MSVRAVPRISVVTVCLNAASTIRRTIESVAGQTQPPHEYIVIDGGSTDGTLEIVKQYPSLVTALVSEKDRGISDAFNKGIALAKGDFIGLLNADDWYEPTTLAQVGAASDHADVIHGDLQHWNRDKKAYLATGNHHNLHREMTIHHPTVFVRRIVYEKLGGFNLSYRVAMDYELMLRFRQSGVRFIHVPSVLAHMSFDGISHRQWQQGIREVRNAKIDCGASPLSANLYYWKQITRSSLARLLTGAGLHSVVKAYRRNFALVRKY